MVRKKKPLTLILNERARREQREKEVRENELLDAWSNDPRHKDSMERNSPLIEDD